MRTDHPNLIPHELITHITHPISSIHCLTLSASQSPLKSLTNHFQHPPLPFWVLHSKPYTKVIVGVWRLLQWSSQASRFFLFPTLTMACSATSTTLLSSSSSNPRASISPKSSLNPVFPQALPIPSSFNGLRKTSSLSHVPRSLSSRSAVPKRRNFVVRAVSCPYPSFTFITYGHLLLLFPWTWVVKKM